MSDNLRIVTLTIYNTTVPTAEILKALEAVGVEMVQAKERVATQSDIATYGLSGRGPVS